MTSRVYTTAEVARMTNFSIRQLDYWARQRLVVPSVQQSCGPGTRKLYAIDDLIQLHFIRQLKSYGWSTQKIRTAITMLQMVMDDPDPLRSAVLVHGKGTLLALCKTHEGERILLDALSAGGQQVMGIVLEELAVETQRVAAGLTDKEISHG
jgi:DNA-binding transcriptional MerR regulator